MERYQRIWRAAAVIVCCAALLAQVPDVAQQAATTWLAKDCDEGEKQALDAIIAQFKTPLEPVFLQALADGPSPQQLAAEQAAAAQRFQQRQEALKTGKGLGLSEADLRAARAVTSEEYTRQQMDSFVLRYKSRAVAGLGIVDGEKGRAALVALAADTNSPLRSSAQAALRRLAGPQGQYRKK